MASGLLLASLSHFSASQRGLLRSQWSAGGSELNGPAGSACPAAPSLSSPGGNRVIKTPLHGNKGVVLGRDPRSFRNSFAWWESLTFQPKLMLAHQMKDPRGLVLAWCSLCPHERMLCCLKEACRPGANDALHLSWGCVWRDQIWDTVSSLQDPSPVDFPQYLLANGQPKGKH